jgi:GAF domain-containing protein
VAADALRAGADDYFTKDRSIAHYERLYHSIQRVVDSRRLHRQQRQLEIEHRRHLRELQALFVLSESIRAELDLANLAGKALEGILSAVAPDFAMVFLRTENHLDLLASGPADSRFAHDETPRHRVGECMCGLAISGGKALYSSDIRNDPRCTWTECRKAGLVSFAALPLVRGQEAIGVVGLASATPRDFEQQAPFLETVTATIAGAVINALRFEELQRRYLDLQQSAGILSRDEA